MTIEGLLAQPRALKYSKAEKFYGGLLRRQIRAHTQETFTACRNLAAAAKEHIQTMYIGTFEVPTDSSSSQLLIEN